MYIYQKNILSSHAEIFLCKDSLYNTSPQAHSNFELAIIEEGEVNLCVDSLTWNMIPGKAALILPHQIYFYTSTKPCNIRIIKFPPILVPQFTAFIENSATDTNVFELDELCTMFLPQLDEIINGESPYAMQSMIYAFCNAFIKQVKLVPRRIPEASPAYQVLLYVVEHYQENITLKNMQLGYESHYLSRIFNESIGMSFRDFLNSYRVEQAKLLLRNTDFSIEEIAESVGFQVRRSFDRAFKNITGLTPLQYRNSQDIISNIE